MRKEVAGLIHDVDGRFAIGNTDVHVQSENEVRAREQLHVFHDFLVTLAFGDELIVPMRKRMRADRRDFQSAAPRKSGELATQINDVRSRLDNRLANFRAELDDRLVHLGFDLLFKRDLAAFEDFLDVRAQLARLRIDNREFLFDAERESMLLLAHGGGQSSLTSRALSSRVAKTTRDLTTAIGSHKPHRVTHHSL